jgi:hypothetical protein
LTGRVVSIFLGLVTVWAALANIAPDLFRVRGDHKLAAFLWGPKTIWVAAIIVAVLVTTFFLDVDGRIREIEGAAQQAKKETKTEETNLQQIAKVVIDLMNAAQARPQPIAQPTPGINSRDVELANRLGALRHAGWKRYLEWLARYPDAEKKAEQWRLEVMDLLEKSYGRAVSSRFNTPTTREAVQIGQTLWLTPVNEHAHRVDRLGEIINDIMAGRLTARG